MTKSIFILMVLSYATLAQAQLTDTTNKNTVYMKVEKMATFASPGTIVDFINRNIHYPIKAYKDHTQGKAVVQFIINTDGTVGYTKVIKPVSAELDSEAVRVVRLSKWYPTIQNSRPVASYFTIPFNFHLP